MNIFFLKHKLIILCGILIAIPIILGVFVLNISTNTKNRTFVPTTSPTVTQVSIQPPTPTENTPTISALPALKLLNTIPTDGSTNLPIYETFTLTFTRPINQQDVIISFSPATTFTQRFDTNTLYIDSPSLQYNTNYTVSLSYASGEPSKLFHFATAPASSSIYQDTAGQNIDAWTKINRPDITVYNKLPYSASDFSIRTISSPGHYSFIVSLVNSDMNVAKQTLLAWLKNTVGLNDEEIAKLDIQYQ